MKRFNGKLIAAFSSFLLASVCLVASTFAWFVLSDTLIVDNLEISLRSSEHLEIGFYSDDAALKAKYGNDIGEWVGDVFFVNPDKPVTSEILTDFNQYDPSLRFVPLSAAYVETYMSVGEGYLPVLTKMPNPLDVEGKRMALRQENSYLQIECYIRSTKNDVYVFIDKMTDIVPDVVSNAETSAAKNVSVEQLDKVVDYMRLSCYSYDAREIYGRQYYTVYEPSPSENENEGYQKTAYFGRLDIDPADGYYDYDYRTGEEVVYGSFEGRAAYSEEARVTEIPDIYDGFQAISHPLSHPFSLADSLDLGFKGRYEASQTPAVIDTTFYRDDLKNAIGYIDRDRPQRFVITCWAEGWDRDCNALSSEASFEISISLTAESSDRYF